MEKDTPDKRLAVMQAAMELIAENGFHAAPTALIAQRADVGAGTIYRYFADKDKLIAAIFQDVEARINETLNTGYPVDGTIRARLDHYYVGLIRYFLGNLVEFKFLGQFYNSPYGIDLRREKMFGAKPSASACDPIVTLFEKGVEAGMIKDMPKSILFGLFFGNLTSIVQDHVQGFIVLDDELISKTAQACWDALRN